MISSPNMLSLEVATQFSTQSWEIKGQELCRSNWKPPSQCSRPLKLSSSLLRALGRARTHAGIIASHLARICTTSTVKFQVELIGIQPNSRSQGGADNIGGQWDSPTINEEKLLAGGNWASYTFLSCTQTCRKGADLPARFVSLFYDYISWWQNEVGIDSYLRII